MNLKAVFYRLLIDPLLSGPKQSVAEKIPSGAKVIDVACGTGSLAALIAFRADQVTGIDLDADLIKYASHDTERKGITNVSFLVKDAKALNDYTDRQFDIAVTSMAVHQFNEELAIQILREMKRISAKVIIADYNYPLPEGFYGKLAFKIERLAKGDHFRNFSNYINRGGLPWFTSEAGLSIRSSSFRGNGVFMIAECD